MRLTTEQRREKPVKSQIAFFASSHDGAKIRYGLFEATAAAPKGTVVVLPGRTEFIEKYFEVIHELLARGYNVAAMDWRGQGLSHRELENRDKHYLTSFDIVYPDLAQCMDEFIKPAFEGPYLLVAHSMGGHLSLRFMHDYPAYFDRAVITSPMCGIQFGALPKLITEGLPKLMTKWGYGGAYAPGMDDYKDGRWGWRKKLTHDDDRFLDEDYFIGEVRDLALGGITYGWMVAAAESIKKLHSTGYPEAITTPICILQAGGDMIVDNNMMDSFIARLPNHKKVIVPDAMHEILKELDQYRDQFWAAFDEFTADQ